MELTGKIIAVLPERSGVSQRTGTEWRCASYVLETMEQYPRKMNFEVFGADRIQQFNIQQGETMVVSFDIDAREFHRQDRQADEHQEHQEDGDEPSAAILPRNVRKAPDVPKTDRATRRKQDEPQPRR